jgi:glucose-1-phosphate cytidylyltransferase
MVTKPRMSVVILCGGQGTRAYPLTRKIPKALMPVSDAPIVEQVMRIYASFGYNDFILSVGYLKEQIIEYFDDVGDRYGWNVTCVDTGDETDTGGRILGLRDYVTPVFHATYCDGLGDVNLDALVRFHSEHRGLATLTAAPLRSQYGLVKFENGGRVTEFEEKPIIQGKWINGGFFVFDERVFDHWTGTNLERDVLPQLGNLRQLHVYKHTGFWRSMDTHKDQQELTPIWEEYAPRYRQEASNQEHGSVKDLVGLAGGD